MLGYSCLFVVGVLLLLFLLLLFCEQNTFESKSIVCNLGIFISGFLYHLSQIAFHRSKTQQYSLCYVFLFQNDWQGTKSRNREIKLSYFICYRFWWHLTGTSLLTPIGFRNWVCRTIFDAKAENVVRLDNIRQSEEGLNRNNLMDSEILESEKYKLFQIITA